MPRKTPKRLREMHARKSHKASSRRRRGELLAERFKRSDWIPPGRPKRSPHHLRNCEAISLTTIDYNGAPE